MGFGLGPFEIIGILLAILLLFGAKRLPEIGSALGRGIREFKGSVREIEGEIKSVTTEERKRESIAPPSRPVEDQASTGRGEESSSRLTTDG